MIDVDKLLEEMTPEQRAKAIAAAESFVKMSKFIPSQGPQRDAYFSKADVLLFGGQPAGGKRLDNRTPVPVPIWVDPSGFKNHGDLVIGDWVYSPSGEPVRVEEVLPVVVKTDAYAVEFDTGEVIVADGDHLWHTWTRKDRDRLLRASPEWMKKRREKRPSRAKINPKNKGSAKSVSELNRLREYEIEQPSGGVRTTREILLTLTAEGGSRNNHSIAVTKPIFAHEQALPIDPYLFGLWLGDGYSKRGTIGMLSDDWKDIVVEDYCGVRIDSKPPRKRAFEERTFACLSGDLRDLGVLNNKHIPSIYLRASLEQRLSLLQGMMDTDGSCNKNGIMECGFSNRGLAEGLHELVSSLGIKATLHTKKTHCQTGAGQDHHRIKFMSDLPCFRLKRKVVKQRLSFRQTVGRRYIKSVTPVASVPMRCIKVSNPNGLYLVGKSFIATHNTSLLIGLANNEHHRSLIVRRQFADLEAVVDNARRTLKTEEGFVGGTRPKYNKPDGGVIHFQGMSGQEELDPSKQGADHDFIGVDEGAQLSRNKILMLMGWNRTHLPNQRCRLVVASNPPVSSEGQWMAEFWGPWLDPSYPNPAKAGEIRWFIMDVEGKSREVDGPETVTIDGKEYHPHSRTYIPSRLEDNPYINADEYRRKLELMPEPWRSIITSGNFLMAATDDDLQVNPMDWIREAVDRWKPQPPEGVPMCAMGVDIAQGGKDETTIARRHDGWYNKLIVEQGKNTPYGRDVAALVLTHRIGTPLVVLDMGGGYGGSTYEHLQLNNDIKCLAYKGGEKSTSRTKDGKMSFANKRAESWWKFREALDPSQAGGSRIALPNDPMLMADLASPRINPEKAEVGIIQIEDKLEIKARIGRSPDRGDAVVMAWAAGAKIEDSFGQWKNKNSRPNSYKGSLPSRR